MTSNYRRPAPDVSNNIRAHLDTTTHHPSFPFSSPSIDDHVSFKSGRSEVSGRSHDPFDSPNPSDRSGGSSEQDEFHLERYSKDNKSRGGSRRSSGLMQSNKKAAPALHLVTDFSKSAYHTNNIIFDQVAAKQVASRENRARSVVSQKGVKMGGSPPEVPKPKQLLHLKDLVQNTKHKRRAIIHSSEKFGAFNEHQVQPSPDRKSVLIGLCVSEHEAEVHNQAAGMESAVTLVTPATPAIILTPPDARDGMLGLTLAKPQRRPVSSMYSTVVFDQHAGIDEDVPPLPPIPVHHEYYPQPLASRNPFRNHHSEANVADWDEKVRGSEDSREHILPDSCDTPRAKSQGWWNLLLSPLLSRANSMASRKGRGEDEIPPVPPLPTDFEKVVSATTIQSTSPETPRRQGLASARASTWSKWTDWEEERERAEDRQLGLVDEEFAPPLIVPDAEQSSRAGEGLAAEYYHACAIEQLAGVTYFECINHSCAEHLPKLKSIYDSPDKGVYVIGSPASNNELIILGSPFQDGQKNVPQSISQSVEHDLHNDDKDSSPGTPIDSDDDLDDLKTPLVVKRRDSMSKKPFNTPIESDLEPDELSPNIRKANTAAVVRARALGTPVKALPTRQKPVVQDFPNIAAVVPVKSDGGEKAPVLSPPPTALESEKIRAPEGAIYMTPYPVFAQSTQPPRLFINTNTSYPELPSRPPIAPITSSELRSQRQAREHAEARRVRHEKEDDTARKAGGLWRGRGCIPKNGCFGRKGGPEGRKKRRWFVAIAVILTLLVILCIILATQLTRAGNGTPVQSQWLNLTGYPPVPTGISTIAQPDLTQSENRCVQPTTMWSCALPKEDQASVAPNDPDQPNFRFQISFRNGTVPANLTIPVHKRASDPFTNDLFVPNPSPPSQADQTFLGNTTDNVTKPFDGEVTPFFITFMSSSPVLPAAYNTTQKLRRDLQDNIPAPALAEDGTAAPASLLPTTPFPISQPVKLYNRGLQDEHYGFYMYYDRSIFLSGVIIENGTVAAGSTKPINADQNGGSTKQAANVRCTWAQTRFLVKMYTSSKFDAHLLSRPQNSSTTTNKKQTTSSATDFTRPGSFPYPTTISLDRHGGSINSKITFCYAMDSTGHIDATEKQLVFENREFGGVLVNAAPSLISNGTTSDGFDSSLGGIDGGSGGCGCTWQNWS